MIVVFDLCGTLYKSNTTFDFVKFVRPKFSRILFSSPVRFFSFICEKFLNVDVIRLFAIKSLKGFSKSYLDARAEVFYENFLREKSIQPTHALLNEYKDNGFLVVLVSASIDPIVSVIAEKLNVRFFSSELSYVDGKSSGFLARDLLGKKSSVLVDFDILSVITDNKTDIDIIERSRKSHIVIDKKGKCMKSWRRLIREQDVFIEVS